MAHPSFWGFLECAPKWFPHPTCPLIRVECRGTLMSPTMSSMNFCPCCFWVGSVAEGMGTAQAKLEGGGSKKSRGLWPEGLLRAGCLWQFSESVRQCISGLIYSFTHLSFLHSSVAYWVPPISEALQMPQCTPQPSLCHMELIVWGVVGDRENKSTNNIYTDFCKNDGQ